MIALVVAPASHGRAYDILPYTGDVQLQDARNPITSDTDNVTNLRKVKIGFYNIEMFTDGIKDGKLRKETHAKAQAADAAVIVDKLDTDILVISEIENERILTMLNDGMKNPYPFGYVTELGTGSSRTEKMNLGFLSRIPPESVKEIDFGLLEGTGRPTRGLLRAIVRLDRETYLVIYAAHLKSNWGKKQKNFSQRVNSMSILLNDVASLYEAHPDRNWEILLVGDFNTDPLLQNLRDDPTLKVLPQWTDLWTEDPDVAEIHTVPTRYGDPRREFPPALFDRVLVHPTLKAEPWTVGKPSVFKEGNVPDIHVRPGEEGHVSDHFPIYFEISK